MTWVRRDDKASIHRKVSPLDDATYRLWSEAIEWCSRNGTDGRIGAVELTEIKRGTKPRAAKLVERILWHEAGYQCDSDKCPPAGADGWVIHDYWEYNPTKADVLAERKAKAERQKRWRDKRSGRYVDTSRDGDVDASRDALRDASTEDPQPVDNSENDRFPDENRTENGAFPDKKRSGNRRQKGRNGRSATRVDALRDATPSRPVPPRPEGSGAGDPPRAPAARRTAAEPAGGGWEEQPPVAHSPNGHGLEDPEALAQEQAEIRATSEAIIAEANAQQRRNAEGAAAARAAIRRPPAEPKVNALDRLRELTPEIPVDQPTEA